MPIVTVPPAELEQRLQPLIRAELASLTGILAAEPRLDEPEYVFLLHASKMSKQASVEQMVAMLRSVGLTPADKAPVAAGMMALQTSLLAAMGRSPLLRAMRAVEGGLIEMYREAHESFAGTAKCGIHVALGRATKRWHVLTAHLAVLGDPDGAERLPRPLGEYFASDRARACMRCQFDRPGSLPALEKDHPRTYVCAACHGEVLANFPPDLRAQQEAWPAALRESRVVERALGRPEKLRAEKEVLAILSGLPVEPPEPPTGRSDPVAGSRERPSHATQAASAPQVEDAGAVGEERVYVEHLLDYRSVRRDW